MGSRGIQVPEIIRFINSIFIHLSTYVTKGIFHDVTITIICKFTQVLRRTMKLKSKTRRAHTGK